ncbi:MAG: long-chain fatty acid--CoA ligase [Chlamydiota bacterium]
MKPFKTVVEVLRHVEKEYSKPNALNFQNLENGWDSVSSKEFVEQVKMVALGLRKLGIKKGDRVGILSNPSPRWTIADFAIMMCGGVSVPLFANISNENFEFEIKHTALKHIFVAGEEQWDMYGAFSSHFEVVISLQDEPVKHKAYNFKEFCNLGLSLEHEEPDLYENMLDEIKPGDLATIVHTSGSTGLPKGVMLSHQNVIGLVHLNPFNWDDELYLNVLPLAHIFARSINFLMITRGIPIYYLQDITTVGDVARELHPTILVVVPRLLEKIYSKMCAKVNQAGFLKRQIGRWAFDLANQEEDSFIKKMMHPIADKIVYSQLRESLGNNLNAVICGGAALNPHVYHFFLDIGVPIYEGWGQTESAVVSCNRPDNIRIGSVGLPFDGTEVKLSEEGELLVKSPLVMQGYYNEPKATKEVFTEDGWLRTGDKGAIDQDGIVSILGRLREMYKTSTGEWIAPIPIEQELCKAPLIDIAMVVGNDKKFASCLIFPDFEILQDLKKLHNQEKLSDEAFLSSNFIKQEMDHLLYNLNKNLNHWEQLHSYRFISTVPTVLGGELTPTMKIRREIIHEKYRHLIDSMYVEEAA